MAHELRQVVELRAPSGFEITDIKIQLKPSNIKVINPPEPSSKIPVDIKRKCNDLPPSLDLCYNEK